MQFYFLGSPFLPVAIFSTPNVHAQLLAPLKSFLHHSIFLGYYLKHFGNWTREPKGSAPSSSTDSEDSDDETESNVNDESKFNLQSTN